MNTHNQSITTTKTRILQNFLAAKLVSSRSFHSPNADHLNSPHTHQKPISSKLGIIFIPLERISPQQEVTVIEKQEDYAPPQSQQAVIRNIWLNYYNKTLLEKGIITAEEYRKMKFKINIKYPAPKL